MEIKSHGQDHRRQNWRSYSRRLRVIRWIRWIGWGRRRGRVSIGLIGCIIGNIKEIIKNINTTSNQDYIIYNGRKRIWRSIKVNTRIIQENNTRIVRFDISNVPKNGTLYTSTLERSSRRCWFSHSLQGRFFSSEYHWAYETY